MAKNIFSIEMWLVLLAIAAAADDCDIGELHMKKVVGTEEEYLERVRRENDVKPTWLKVDSAPMPIVVTEEEIRVRRESEMLEAISVATAPNDNSGFRSSGNPDPGNVAITDVLPEAFEANGGSCTEVAEPYGFPDCMKWTVYNGKILFRLNDYDYTRSRANDACQAMGGFLAIAFTEQDHQDINDFLDYAIGEPTGLAGSGGLGGADSWFAPIASDQSVNGEVLKMWFGQQCDPAGFHLCNHYKDKETGGFWDDCGDPYGTGPCTTCNHICDVVPTYLWDGVGPQDPPEPNCMEYKPAQDPNLNYAQYEYYWHEANCDRQIAALCEIDFKEVGCNAFGIVGVTSPKWKVSCIHYEWCNNGVIEFGTCPDGMHFDQYHETPDCYDRSEVLSCDIDECDLETHDCHVNGLCTNTVGSWTCSCEGNYEEYNAGDVGPDGTVYSSHTCVDIDECLDPGSFSCVVDSSCSNRNGTYACECNEWLAAVGLDADGNPTACADDDECSRPDTCGANSVCANNVPGYYCSCAMGYYDTRHETADGAWGRIDAGIFASDPNATYVPLGNDSLPIYGMATECVDADECDDDRDTCDNGLLNVCENTDGSYICVCAHGTREADPALPMPQQCVDIDECFELSFVCDPEAACVNDILTAMMLTINKNAEVDYSCQCRSGWNNTGYSDTYGHDICVNVDECANQTDPFWENQCGADAECHDSVPNYVADDDNQLVPYVCSCPLGFLDDQEAILDPPYSEYEPHKERYLTTCEDRDECSDEPNPENTDGISNRERFCNPETSSVCDNTHGWFNCGCNTGYSQNAFPNTGCGDNNECHDNDIVATCAGVAQCSEEEGDCVQCVNAMGSYFCGCNDGWDYVGSYDDAGKLVPVPADGCTDCDGWDEVAQGGPCTLCGPKCANWNECLNGESKCGVGWTVTDHISNSDIQCTDTTGSYFCTCPSGYYSADENAANHDQYGVAYPPVTGVNAPPGTTEGGYSNSTWDKKCYDIDECAYDICNRHNGAEVDPAGLPAEYGSMGDHKLCYNRNGTHECKCANGFELTMHCAIFPGDIEETCVEMCFDINECEREYPCLNTTTRSDSCTNTFGSYYCECGVGYTQNSNTTYNETYGDHANTLYDVVNYYSCDDVNECDDKDSYCDTNSYCNNTDGSYVCWCDEQLYIDTYGNGTYCDDLDECTTGHACNVTSGSECQNFFGGYMCTCLTGFRQAFNWTGLPDAFCEDIPECEEGVDTCIKDPHEDLESFPFTLQEPHCTNSSDLSILNRCGLKASCENTIGSFICTCNYPYTGTGTGGVGTGCNYPRECAIGTDSCPRPEYYDDAFPDVDFDAQPTECYELPYFFQCRCAHGYFQLPDGQTCDTYDFSEYMEEADDYANNNKDLWCDDFNYTIGGDGIVNETTHYYACIDIDECSSAYVSICGPNSICENSVGSHICMCMDGYEGDGVKIEEGGSSCGDINECDTNAHNCPTDDLSGECVNTEGTYECYCLDGYKDDSPAGNGTSCRDCDECTENQHDCDANADCENFIGTFECTCREGFSGDGHAGQCQDVDECAMGYDDCHNFAACANNFGSFECICMQGFVGDGRTANATIHVGCLDEDECDNESHNCNGLAVCINNDGSYNCECNLGYLGDGYNHTVCAAHNGTCCHDMDECSSVVNVCGIRATCNNTVGSYTCGCEEEGFRLSDDGYSCEDIDECDAATCADYNACPDCDSALGVCTNTPGNYSCSCQDGYQGDGYGEASCSEINQCDWPGLFTCPFNATCVEATFADGDYSCECNEGFIETNIYCRDVDECAENPHPCDTLADCINTEGSYQCACQDGYTGDGLTAGSCTNIDECTDGTDPCNANATCTDDVGTYSCACDDGYFGDGEDCYDIDECQSGGHNCCLDSGCFCTNGDGWHTCGCEDGYDGDGFLLTIPNGRACTNENECSDNSHNCDTDNAAICTDTTGGFACTCPAGYNGDGVLVAEAGSSCTDIDECRFCPGGSEEDPLQCLCNVNANCTNLPNTFQCHCDEGFTGDGVTCIDINECITGEDNCHDDATCTNLEPSFKCDCDAGYTGDGETCTDVDECLQVPDPCNSTANTMCVNDIGSYTCPCLEGFVDVNGECLDLDECFEGPSSPNADACPQDSACVNTEGTYECECNEGYQGTFMSVDTFSCTNIDECVDGVEKSTGRKRRDTVDACPVHADCIDSVGSFTCECHDGYDWSADDTDCVDIDECLTCYFSSITCVCGANQLCGNTNGSFTCTCEEGYELAVSGDQCDDIDECADNTFDCPDHSTCNNLEASYECVCDTGYEKNAVGDLCVDSNECIPCDSDPRDFNNCKCDVGAFCINTDGSFECWCPLGWWMQEDECVDVDECTAPEYLAGQTYWNASAAAAMAGHFVDVMGDASGRRRRDVDDAGAACSPTENCVNSEGSHSCECIDGHSRDQWTNGTAPTGIWADIGGTGPECVDIDECAIPGNCPATGATCVNTIGSYNCTCNPGFTAVEISGKIHQCVDINECQVNTAPCGPNSICANSWGAFTCTCLSGFEKIDPTDADGLCQDVDECALGAHFCQHTFPLICVNIDGSYECQIPPGMNLDGKLVLDWLSLMSELLDPRNPGNGTAFPPVTQAGNITGFEFNTTTLDPFTEFPPTNWWETTTAPDAGTLPPGVTNPPPNNISAVTTGENGEAEIAGDPHARVGKLGGTPICFNFYGDDHRFVDLLSDSVTNFEVNAEIKSLGAVTRLIAVGVKFTTEGVEYRWMLDENGMSFWIDQEISETIAYGDVTSGKQPGHVSWQTFGTGKPGMFITLNHVAEFQITFKDKGHKKTDPGKFIEDNHSMGFKTISLDGASHSMSGILGQFLVPNSYETHETGDTNFVIFHDRHIPATKHTFHGTRHCMQVEDAFVATLLGNPIRNFYVDTLFGDADVSAMRDSFLKYVT